MTAALVLLVSAACGPDESSGETLAPSLKTSQNETTLSVEGEPFYMSSVDKAYFQSLEEMYNASEIVVVDEVIDVELGEILGGVGMHPDEQGFPQMGVMTVRVDQLLRGKIDESTVTVVRESFLNEGDMLRPLNLDGFEANNVGDRVLWFLEQSSGRAQGIYEQVSFDGLLYIEDGVITTPLVGDDRLAHSLDGMPASDLVEELSAMADQP